MTNKILLTLLIVASQVFAFAQDLPKKKANFYLGTSPSVTSKFDQSEIASNLFLRTNSYTKSPTELEQNLQENYNQGTVPILFIAELKNSLSFVLDFRATVFNYDANKNTTGPFWNDKNGFRSENVRGFGIYQYYGVGKSYRFLENKTLSILPHVGAFMGSVSSTFKSKSRLDGNDNSLEYSNFNSSLGIKAGVIVNYDISKRIALGLNLDNIIGFQRMFESRGDVAEDYSYNGFSSEFSNSRFYLSFKF